MSLEMFFSWLIDGKFKLIYQHVSFADFLMFIFILLFLVKK